jgi:SAM-dependent methyltransferase
MHSYRHDFAFVYERLSGQHADRCAPGILELLAPVRDGLVVELGCGSGALTRHLLAAGLRVIATDASRDMLELARVRLGPDVDLRQLTLPDDPLPGLVDAIVSVGHAISYVPDAAAVDRTLTAAASALRPGGILAIDVCDLAFGEIAPGSTGRTGPDWAVISQYSRPAPDKLVRDITTFVLDGSGSGSGGSGGQGGLGGWRRDSEHHENVLVDTVRLPALLAEHGVTATVGSSFGAAELPSGLMALTGIRS